jgi:hypothetical protein
VLQNYYKDWFAGERLFSSGEEPSWKLAGLSEYGIAAWTQSNRPGFARTLLKSFARKATSEHASVWSHPTERSEPTAAQLNRFPLNDYGVPSAPNYLVVPVDSQPQTDIPEQMLVGSPPREQLYL